MKALIPMYVRMQTKMQSMLKDEKGATMVEYALMVALIAVALIGAVTGVKNGLSGEFDKIVAALK